MAGQKTKISEEDLVELLQGRSEKGFSVLYNNYSGAIFGVIKKIVISEDIAADVTQDVFVKIWKNLENYNKMKGTIFTWMLNIARNSAIDKLRSADYRQGLQNLQIETYVGVVDNQNSVALNIDAIGLQNVIAKLRPEYRQLIDLVYYKGYTQSEIAEEFDIPLGTVKTRIKAAVAALRTFLNVFGFIILSILNKIGY